MVKIDEVKSFAVKEQKYALAALIRDIGYILEKVNV